MFTVNSGGWIIWVVLLLSFCLLLVWSSLEYDKWKFILSRERLDCDFVKSAWRILMSYGKWCEFYKDFDEKFGMLSHPFQDATHHYKKFQLKLEFLKHSIKWNNFKIECVAFELLTTIYFLFPESVSWTGLLASTWKLPWMRGTELWGISFMLPLMVKLFYYTH